jgi:hypothetical protein
MLPKADFLLNILLDCQDKVPLCIVCHVDKSHCHPWRHRGKRRRSICKEEHREPVDGVSIDQIVSAQPGLIPQLLGFFIRKRVWSTTAFVDHISNYVYGHLMRDFTLEETILAKSGWENY